MRFKAGDPVWAKVQSSSLPICAANMGVPVGEHAAVIDACIPKWGGCYIITILAYPCPDPTGWMAYDQNLRPRRDDYQQHEGLSSREKIERLRSMTVTEKEPA